MTDKTIALVTGANQGIGLQIAKELAAAGLTVLVGARDPDKGDRAVTEIGGDVHVVQLDVTDKASISAAAEHIRNAYGRLDVLVQNAAISNAGTAAETVEQYAQSTRPSNISLKEMRAIWETNVFGVLMVYQAMLPLLRQSTNARIVNVSSSVGSLALNANPDFPYRAIFGPGYAASKTALNALTLAMAIELEPEGIKVNAVSPGFTSTALNNFTGTETVEDGAREAVRVALLGPDGPTGTFSGNDGVIQW